MKLKKEKFIKIAEKYATKKATKKEEEIVSVFFDSLQGKEIDIKNEQRVKFRILKNIKAKTNKVKKYNYYKIAATVTIFICLGTFLFNITKNNTVYYATQKGERKNITLPDGSTVYLNSESNIVYNKNFKNNRHIALNGEAFFTVVKDSLHPFIVKTSTIRTKVLGTSFNIQSPKNKNAVVTVNTGRVSVKPMNNNTIEFFLVKNESISYNYNNQSFNKKNIIADNYSSWTENTLWFNNLTLLEVSKKLESWFNIDIKIKDESLKTLKLTGIYRNPELKKVLESIKFLKKIEYDIKDDKIVIDKLKKDKKPM